MKMNCWLVLGIMLSTSLTAQEVTNAPPAAAVENPAPAAALTNAPAAKPAKKKAAPKKKKPVAKKKTPAAELRTVPLAPGPAVVEANNVNVRGQPRLKSEVITRMTKGQAVTVIEEITRKNSGPDEPSAWAKIALPSSVHVWVNTAFIDPTNKTVVAKRLNLRGGPGENYSVLGRMQRGEGVNPVSSKGEWTEIEAPTNAYAFMAAQYLKQEPAAPPIAAVTAPATPVESTPATVTESPTIAAAQADHAGTNAPPELADANEPAEDTSTNVPPAAAVEEPLPKRVVLREGIVRGTFSIQAPTHYELISPGNGKTIDFLYTTSPHLDLSRYKGLKIVVTGEESLDDRWGNTPVITIQKIQVLE
jgi:uncharacterized protein YgiM (DUF1202 family)